MRRLAIAGLAIGLAWSQMVGAGQVAETEGPAARAVPLAQLPIIDGEVLDDEAWEGVPFTGGFVQRTPNEGQAASQETRVFIGFSADTLYIAVVCLDDEPDRIIVADSRRDSSLDESDSFQILLDTYQDELTAFVFGTNPAGIEFDGQVAREGQGGAFSASGFNKNWDGVWEVRAKVSQIGWSAELAIPFTTLRYPIGEAQTWSLNMQRNIRRHNEQSFWSPVPVQFTLFRITQAGTLEGLEVPPQRNLTLMPYARAIVTRSKDESGDGEDFDAGLDLKYSLTPSLTLDATVNTDFAQVEVDELQINLDRFNLFFPEKRPFFLENAGYFSMGVPRAAELFFSRRIGIGPNGEIVPIEAGARISGKVAQYFNIGALYMRTDGLEGVNDANDSGVFRFSRDLPNRSSFGGIVVGRKGHGSVAGGDDENLTLGLDGRWGIGDSGLIQGFIAKTETPGIDEDDHAFHLAGNYDTERYSMSASYTEIGEGFNPELGFLSRKGYRKPSAFILRRIRPDHLWGLLELRPHISYAGYWDFDGFHETSRLHVDNHWEWRNGNELHTGVNFTHEGVTEAFEIHPDVTIPEGSYDHSEVALLLLSNRGAPASFQLRTVIGGFFGGDRVSTTPSLLFRLGETFNAEASWTFNDIDLPGGSFRTNLGRLRLNYSFTTRMSLQALIQYNDRADIWAANLRFAWLRSAGTGLHVVYNEVEDLHGTGTLVPNRGLVIKYSHLFDLLR